MSEWGPGEPRTHTLKGLSCRLGRRPALCPGCWVLQSDGVLLHCMRPRLHLDSDWACKISANPLLPEGFSLHILPADYHHCQSWLLHSSCCPHCGSGANLTRLHGGRKLIHTRTREAELLHSKAPPRLQLVALCRNLHQPLLPLTTKRATLLTLHAFPSGFPKWTV